MRPRQPLLPPGQRSRAALRLVSVAGEGRFALPCCTTCGSFVWPIPELCPKCLGEITLQVAPRQGVVLSATTVEASADPYFRERAPWHVGLVQMDAGPSAIVHLHPPLAAGARAQLTLMLDRAGQAVLHAGPISQEDSMQSDPQWQEMVCDPRGRRVLITDARHIAAPALAQALLAAGAAEVVLGLPESWKPFAARAALKALPAVRLEPLDLASDRSVQDLATQVGGKVEILINTADILRPGGLWTPQAPVEARAAMETVAFGLHRLARAFGPAMAARGADGQRGAVAWVNLLSVFAHAHPPELAGYGAAHAAALALSQSLRAELAQGGVRLMTVFTGPTEDDWFQRFAPPRVAAKPLAAAIVNGLQRGLEEVVVGDVARDLMARHRDDPKALQRELAQGRL
ncbi:MAG TPA: SDR family NAD(P)-dependent oxidoreductase [Tabrizicola sp.]|nr:SDR family NAD(P)-dependent oxidoreductase [Tabrizicola sp.]